MNNKDFITNTLKYCIPSIFAALISIVAIPIISAVYPSEEYGYISNFYSVGNLMMSFLLFGLDGAYIRFYNERVAETNSKGMLFFVIKTSFIFSLVFFGIAFCIDYRKVTIYLFNDDNLLSLLLFYIYVVSLICYRLLNITYRFSENAKLYNIQQVFFILVNKLLFIVAGLISTNYLYSILIMCLLTALIVVLSFIYIQKNNNVKPLINVDTKKAMIKYALPLMPSSIVTYFNNAVAKGGLGLMGFRSDVGVLAIATSISNIFAILPSAFSVYWGTYMYKYYKTDKIRIKKIQSLVTTGCCLIVVLIFCFQDIVFGVLKSNYVESQNYFMLVMFVPIVSFLCETTAYGISISKKTKLTFMISCISSFINLFLCVILIPKYKAVGAALSISISSIITYLLQTYYGQKYYSSILDKRKTFVETFITFFVCYLNLFLYKNILLRIIISFIIFIILVVLNLEDIILLYKRKKKI